MFLITSGAFIDQEFASEIGLLPPSFLPVGNRCLYEYQVELGEQLAERICLSIPASYVLSDYEQAFVADHRVELIRVPEGLSLGESILYCLNMTGSISGSLRILHGDTLFHRLPPDDDCISVSPNTGYYHRAMVGTGQQPFIVEGMAVDDDQVLSGFFSFSCVRTLIRNITQHRGKFVAALNGYHAERPLTPLATLGWYDFGHINSYFGSRAHFTTQRSFNALQIDGSTVRKTSDAIAKMRGESHWFDALPRPMQIYAPKLVDRFEQSDQAGYSLEYVYNLPLSDLFVFGRLAKETWRSVFRSCRQFVELGQRSAAAGGQQPAPQSVDGLYLPKTLSRLDQFSAASGFDVEAPVWFNDREYPSPNQIAAHSSRWIAPATAADIAVVHGDFCFSNILYDFRTRRIKVVDPRGIDLNGEPTLLGDVRYDYAKLYHSVYGLYDLIVAGRLRASYDGATRHLEMRDFWFDYHQGITGVFEEVFFAHQPQLVNVVRAINVHLFLSMLPLHGDRPDRQMTMLANAYRLFAELQEEDAPCS